MKLKELLNVLSGLTLITVYDWDSSIVYKGNVFNCMTTINALEKDVNRVIVNDNRFSISLTKTDKEERDYIKGRLGFDLISYHFCKFNLDNNRRIEYNLTDIIEILIDRGFESYEGYIEDETRVWNALKTLNVKNPCDVTLNKLSYILFLFITSVHIVKTKEEK